MKTLGTIFIVIGIPLMVSVVGFIPGAVFVALGALLRMAARPRRSAGELEP